MTLNIGIGLAIAVLTFVTAGLGGHLASTKPWHKWVFWGCGGLMLLLVFAQVVSNEHAQTDLTNQIGEIRGNTKVIIQNTVDTKSIAEEIDRWQQEAHASNAFGLRQQGFLLTTEMLKFVEAENGINPKMTMNIGQPITVEVARGYDSKQRAFNAQVSREFKDKFSYRLRPLLSQLKAKGANTSAVEKLEQDIEVNDFSDMPDNSFPASQLYPAIEVVQHLALRFGALLDASPN